jgi:hypothetical protein
MRQKIYGIFSNVNDAKQAFGSIKKESLNQADLTIVFANDQETKANHRKDNYEFATEYFIETPRNSPPSWPGLKEESLSGIGKIQIGFNIPTKSGNPSEPITSMQLAEGDLGIIEREIKAHKVVTIIEAEPEFVPKLRLILESNGAEIISIPEK